MHCIVFVIKATTNLNDPENKALKKIKELQKKINGPRNVSVIHFIKRTNSLKNVERSS